MLLLDSSLPMCKELCARMCTFNPVSFQLPSEVVQPGTGWLPQKRPQIALRGISFASLFFVLTPVHVVLKQIRLPCNTGTFLNTVTAIFFKHACDEFQGLSACFLQARRPKAWQSGGLLNGLQSNSS